MRVTSTDVPRRPIGLRGWLIGAAVVLVIFFLSARGLARFYTDYLWFKEVGFSGAWRRLLSAKFAPALIFSTIFFVIMLTNLIVADRLAPRYRSTAGPEDEIIERYRTYVAPYSGRLRVLVSLFFALVMGGGVSAEWRSWILFSNAVDVPGPGDPQFHKNIGFYLFRLPFIQFAVGWTFAALLVVLIVTAVFHYLNGGIRLQSPWQRVTPQVKVHLSVILALMALTKTAQYFYARYELVFSTRGFVDGASYTDVKAQLPALNLLMIISICAAGLFIANIFRKGWVFPIIAVGLWGFISLVVGTIYPAVVQRFSVQPNELTKESEYIERNIQATRTAFGIDDVTVKDFAYDTTLDPAAVDANIETLDNARLWGPSELGQVVRATQEIQTFYKFDDVDVERYSVGDNEPPALIAPRELDASNIPDKTWTNRHLVYTAGCGAIVALGNEQREGEPNYLLQDIPPAGQLASQLDQPRVYFGEGSSGYVVVDSKLAEQGCTEEGDTEAEPYEGEAGVSTSSFLRKAAFGLRFNDWNLVFSGQLTGESRILYNRDISERVRTAAPFLRFDADPYPVVIGGNLLWVVDAYTTSNHYPYSQSLHPSNLPEGSGLDTDFNYVRNSVKATVDAYDGTIHFYVVDKTDPMIQVYQSAFPDLFDDTSQMPEGLREHWRYPEDLFRAQTEHYTSYHMTNPSDFFRKRTLWDIAPAPDEGAAAAQLTTQTTTANDTELAATLTPVEPLYLTMQLPGEENQEFVLQRPFVPRAKPNQLSAFMYARTDGDNYGKLVVYQIPANEIVPSPNRAASLVTSEPVIRSQVNLLRAGAPTASQPPVDLGALQLIPIDDSIVYLQSIYVKGTGSGNFPRLRFVAVTYGEDAALVDYQQAARDRFLTIEDAVKALVTGQTPDETDIENPDEETPPDTTPTTEGTTPPTGETPTTQPPLPDSIPELLAEADAEFAAADVALREGGPGALAEYQTHIERAREAVARANQLSAQAASGAPTTTTTTITEPLDA